MAKFPTVQTTGSNNKNITRISGHTRLTRKHLMTETELDLQRSNA